MGHKLGQVFLHDKNILEKIMMSLPTRSHESAVEIGCGDGILTNALLSQFKQVLVYEIDPVCIEKTQARVGLHPNLEFIRGDVLTTAEAHPFVHGSTVVANVPYYITTPIIKVLIALIDRIESATLMVQKEFAEKLIATAGDPLYTSFSVYSGFHFKAEKLFAVPKTCFSPVPKVDSAVVRLTPQWVDIPGDRNLFFAMVHSGFWGRRKPFSSALSKSPYVSLDPQFKRVDFFQRDPNRRAEDISPREFLDLFSQITPYFLSQA